MQQNFTHLSFMPKPGSGFFRYLKSAALLLPLTLFGMDAFAQVPIVYYNFQQNTANYDPGTNNYQRNPNQTINTGVDVSNNNIVLGGTDGAALYYNGAATGAGAALNASNWSAVGSTDPGTAATEYFIIQVNTSGLENLSFKVDAKRGTDGPQKLGVFYQVGAGSLVALSGGHNVGTGWATYDIPMESITDIDNQGSVTFYLYGYDVTGSGTKTMAIDNLQILARTISGGTKNLLNEGTIYTSTTSATGKFIRDELNITGSGTQVTVGSALEINNITVNNGSSLNVNSFLTTKSSTAGKGVILESGSTVKFGGTAYINGDGEFNLKSGANIEIASQDGISAAGSTGNVQVAGTRTFADGANYKYIGYGPADTGSGLPANISGSLTVNLNPSSVVKELTFINAATTVSGTINFNSGKVNTTATEKLIIDASATVTGGSTSSYVDGPLAYLVENASGVAKTLNFEIGDGDKYRKVILVVTHSDNNPATYTATQIDDEAPVLPFVADADELDRVSKIRYFTINKSGTANGTAVVTLTFDTDDVVNQTSNLRIAKTDGVNWQSIGGTVVGNTITSNSFPTFSTFALGNKAGGTNPLPVELASFTATKKGKDVVVEWSTASERDNKGFEVQVAQDKAEFRTLGYVASKNSNSNSILNYTFTDTETGKTGIRYYRLKQIDFAGSVSYSALKVVSYGKADLQVMAYPNPVEEQFIIQVASGKAQTATLEITDALGRKVYTKNLTLQEGANQTAISLPASVTKGVYTMELKTAEGNAFRKIVKE